MKISIDELQAYLSDRYSGWATEQSMFMKLVEEIGEVAEVIVYGDGDTDLDLYIYDENWNLITSDTDYTDICICRWNPIWTGNFYMKVVNRGNVYNEFVIATN